MKGLKYRKGVRNTEYFDAIRVVVFWNNDFKKLKN